MTYSTNYIEIVNAPKCNNEAVTEVVVKVIKDGLKVPIAESDIDLYYRKKPNASGKGPGIIVAKLVSYRVKERILNAKYKAKSKVTAGLIDPGARGVVYVNDWLSGERKQLLSAAKEARRTHNYGFLWVRNGKILMRRKTGDEIRIIRCLADLEKL